MNAFIRGCLNKSEIVKPEVGLNKSEICKHGAGLVKSYCKFAIVRLDLTEKFCSDRQGVHKGGDLRGRLGHHQDQRCPRKLDIPTWRPEMST